MESPASASKIPNIKGSITGSFALPTMVKNTTPLNLTATLPAGSITESGVAYAYQWIRVNRQTLAETAIVGATGAVYTPVAADYPYRLKVRVTITKLNYNSEVLFADARDYSLRLNPGYAPPAYSSSVIVEVDQVLSAAALSYDYQLDNGTFATVASGGGGGLSETRTWLRSGLATGVFGGSYLLNPVDVGKTITYKLDASIPGYLPVVQTASTAKGPVALAVLDMVGSPGITGPVGLQLTATFSAADVMPAADVAPTIQWTRNGVAIPGATATTYTLVTADFGKEIAANVTYKRAGYQNRVQFVGSSGSDIYSVLNGSPPFIQGNLYAGQTIQASYGYYINGIDGTTIPGPDVEAGVTYQWLRNGVVIPGQTSYTYLTDPVADKGKAISARVTVTIPGLLPNVQTTPATQLLGSAPLDGAFPPVQPSLILDGASTTWTQILGVGNTITGPVPIVVTYQWLRNGVAIVGATKAKYTLTAADRGKQISVRITSSKAAVGTTTYTKVVHDSTAADLTLNASAGPDVHIYTTFAVGSELAPTVPAFTDSMGATVNGWSQQFQWYRDGIAIAGAIAPNYFLKAADLGKKITVRVTTGKVGYISHVATYTTSPATLKVLGGTLLGTGMQPTVSVSVPATNTLLATPPAVTGSTETGSPTAAFTYKWLRNGVAITGATASTYKLVAADTGKNISVRVTASLAGYTTAVLPDSTPLNYDIKVIVGSEPYASIGTWETGAVPSVYGENFVTKDGALASPTIKYQWLRGGVAIAGAINHNYMLQPADVGKLISVRLTVSAPGYLPLVYTTANPQIGVLATTTDFGAVQVDVTNPGTNTLTASIVAGSLLPQNPAPAIAYQWLRDSAPITGATAASYKLTALDFGKLISARLTLTRAGFTQVVLPAIYSPQVNYSILSLAAPTLDNMTPKAGDILGVSPMDYTDWNGFTITTTPTYQWLRNNVVIPGATGDTYQLQSADYNTKVSVRVTATYPGYVANIQTTPQTPLVLKGLLADAGQPLVTAGPTGILSVSYPMGVITTPSPTFTYQWYRDDATTPAVPGVLVGTGATYQLTSADRDRNITVKVTLSKLNFVTAGNATTLQLTETVPINYSIENGGTIDISPNYVEVGYTLFPDIEPYYTYDNGDVPVTRTYQWLRNGVVIAGATLDSYTAVAADVGTKITVRVTAASPGYIANVFTTAPTQTVVKGNFSGTGAAPLVNASPAGVQRHPLRRFDHGSVGADAQLHLVA